MLKDEDKKYKKSQNKSFSKEFFSNQKNCNQ